MIRFTPKELDTILADFLGKPWQRYAAGPDAYDCYGLTQAFLERLGVQIADIGKVDPTDSRPVYERQQSDYIRLAVPRPWSLVTFSNRELNAHIGVVLPGDNLFLHCPGRAAGKVIAEPLSRRPWRDSVDGYWWPKGYIETVVLLTPMTTTKRAWQFVKAGRCLAEIIEQDITEGRDVPVQVFLDGELIEQDRWMEVVPTELQQIVVRPVMGDGPEALMMVGMVALAIFAAPAAGALAAGTTGSAVAAGTATAGQAFIYHLASAATMMAGGLALNALVGSRESDRESSQYYAWDPQTTQRVGSFLPLVYGTYGVRGNILCAYATSEYTYSTNFFTKAQQIRFAKDLYHIKIGYSDGPIEGIIEGTEKINDRGPDYYAESASFTVEHFRGTDDQAASSIPDAFEIPVGLDCATNEPATTIFRAVDCDNASLVLRFPNGFTDYEKDGGHKSTAVTIKAEIRVENGAWHTLMNGNLYGDSRNPMRINLDLAASHAGGTPFVLVAGTRYEARITRLDNTHSDKGDSFLFDCVQFRYRTPQKLPGIAYTAIGAAASREISGSIQYYAKIKGKLVRVYRGGVWTIEWSDNPAWVAYDLLTRPVIKGNGSTVPYAVEYYKRLDPSYLNLADFAAFAAWCDELVPDGKGGTEKRYVFNGVFDADGSAWEQAIRVCQMACATPFFRGHKIGVAIDKPGTPSQMFNVSNLREGFVETWLDNSEAATVYDVEFADEQADYVPESYPVPRLDADQDIPASLDGFGHTKRSQVWRRASRQLRVNQYMRRTVELPASLDAVWSHIGDIVYVQHPALNRAIGGRIAEVYADGIQLDKPVTMGAGDHALLIRTHDGTAERLSLYTVASVAGADSDIVTISGVWEYEPQVNDLWTFGEQTKVIDLYRIKGFERTRDGQVLIQGTQYTTDYYDADEDAPVIQPQVYRETKGGKSSTLTPTTAESVKTSLPDGNSELDSLIWEGLAFTGNGTDTVTWTCESTGGAGIKYQGVWVPIFDDAVGTTDKYVYFDPNVGDPRYLQHTDDINALAGQERYVFCVNDQGTAYFKPGLVIGAEELKLDGIAPGADVTADSPVEEFRDVFDDPQNNVKTRWVQHGSTATMIIVTGGVAGGKALRVVGFGRLVYYKSIAYDPSKLYRVRVRVRRTAGTGTCYIGVAGRDATDTRWVNTLGNDSYLEQHHIAGANVDPGSEWTVYTGYFWGQAGSVDAGLYSDPAYPAPLHSNACYFRPTISVNGHTGGTTEIDEFSIDIAPEIVQDVTPSVFQFGAYGDDSHDDTSALQAAIDDALATGRPVFIPKPAVAYKITQTLTVNNGLFVQPGFRLQGEGWPCIRWHGATGQTMMNILSIAESQIDGLVLDGNSVSGVSGIYHSTGPGRPSQRNSYRHVWVLNCPGVGITIEHQGAETTDYVTFEQPALHANGINLKVMGGARQVILHGGSLTNAGTYNVYLHDCMFTGFDTFFALAGTSDIYLASDITAFKLYGCASESRVILTNAPALGGSHLLGANILCGFQQSAYPDPSAAVMDYNIWQPLILIGCKFQNNVNIGASVSSVTSVGTDFFPAGAFTGSTEKVFHLGAAGSQYFQNGPLLIHHDSRYPSGLGLRNTAQNRYSHLYYSESVPDSYYYNKGDIVLNAWPAVGDPIGWRCVASGDGPAQTVKATFEPIAGATDFIKTLLDDADAAAARTTLGLGTIATQAAHTVAITGGSITGITDLAMADGGTGASDAATARTNLGLGTAHSPQFTAVNLGHASDTTVSRHSAGNLAVEGNLVYRAGGTGVPVADGGTGASTAAAARTNLGIPQPLADTPTDVSGNYVMQASDNGKWFTTNGIAAGVALEIMPAVVGATVAVTRSKAGSWVNIYKATGAEFRCHPGLSIQIPTDGMTCVFKCIEAGIWDMLFDPAAVTWW